MHGFDARKLAGFLERCSWADGPLSAEDRGLLWLAATWLDHEGKVLEVDSPGGPSTLPPDGRLDVSDFSRGSPANGVAVPSLSLGGGGLILAGDTYALPVNCEEVEP